METTMDEWRGKVKALERELADMTKRHATAEAALTAKKSELGGVVKTLEDAEADRADNSQVWKLTRVFTVFYCRMVIRQLFPKLRKKEVTAHIMSDFTKNTNMSGN